MGDATIEDRVATLLHEAAETHHVVYRITDGTDADLFCLARFLPAAATQVFDDLTRVRRELASDGTLPSRLATWYADLNALHPFREGNGRTQRTFLWLLCMRGGVRLDMSAVTAAGNLAASVAAMNGDSTGFHAALRIAAGQPVEPGDEHWVEVLTG